MDLTAVSTYDLVEALISREGVECKCIEPYNTIQVAVVGPSKVLVVSD